MIIRLTDEQLKEITIEYLMDDYNDARYHCKHELCDLLLDVLEHYGISEIEANARCGI
jgi:adenine C2-methylase RlmN of 23S rRNA A2503 and tRNA A37